MTLSSYLLRLTIKPLLLIIATGLVAMLLDRMLRLLDVVLSSSGSLQPLLQLLGFMVPYYLGLAIPLAFFLCVLLAISNLNQRRELEVMAAAGAGILTLLRPILLLAVLLSLLSILNAGWLQPYARYLYRLLLERTTEAVIHIAPRADTFMEVSGVTFMAESVDADNQRFSKIFIYRERKDGASETITANAGALYEDSGDQRALLALQQGVRLGIGFDETAQDNRDTGFVAAADMPWRVLQFDRARVPLDLVGKSAFEARGRAGSDQRELTLPELWPYGGSLPGSLKKRQALSEFNDRVVRAISILFLPFFAVGIAAGTQRVSRGHVIAVGLLALIAYNEVLSYGRQLVSNGTAPTLLVQWLPLLLATTGSVYLFHRVAVRVPRTGGPDGALVRGVHALRKLGRYLRLVWDKEL